MNTKQKESSAHDNRAPRETELSNSLQYNHSVQLCMQYNTAFCLRQLSICILHNFVVFYKKRLLKLYKSHLALCFYRCIIYILPNFILKRGNKMLPVCFCVSPSGGVSEVPAPGRGRECEKRSGARKNGGAAWKTMMWPLWGAPLRAAILRGGWRSTVCGC